MFAVVHFPTARILSTHRTLRDAQDDHSARVWSGGIVIPNYQDFGIMENPTPAGLEANRFSVRA